MNYITNNDIEDRIGTSAYVQLTDDAGTGSADVGRVDEARLGAEGEVDSYLARRYRVPIDLVTYAELGGLLRSVTLDLASYRLYSRRPPIPADVVDRRAAAVGWLRAVAEGRVELPSATTVSQNPATGVAGKAIGETRVLNRDDLRDV
jgi:phage gp36-like protein